MRQLTSLDAQFLNVESPTTVGHVGSLILLDPATAPDGTWNLDSVRRVVPYLALATGVNLGMAFLGARGDVVAGHRPAMAA